MSRRETWSSILLIAVVAAVVRVLAAGAIVFPKPEDTAYYVGAAESLLAGRGLVTDAIWSYGTPPLTFPRPAFEVWLPLPTFLAVVPMAIFGPSFAAAQVSSVIAGVVVAVLAWRLAADVAVERGLPMGRARIVALGTGLTSAVYLPLVLHSALPDSTMPFAALTLGATLLAYRILRSPPASLLDARLIGLGMCLGFAALTRNEAAWLALAWVAMVALAPGLRRGTRLRLVGTAAVVAILVFLPWAWRNWATFGSPLPGQAATNALSVTGFDIFAWSDPPTLGRYLAVGPERLLGMRLDGVAHNLFNVLLLLGVPVAFIGLAGLTLIARQAATRLLLVTAAVTFLFTSLVFPVATTWGTFLHAAGAIHVLLIISALVALDAALAALAARLHWTRPVAWLGALLTVGASVLFSAAVLPAFGSSSRETMQQYAALENVLAAVDRPLGASGPVITNFPIWLAEATGAQALALPDESPVAVLDLARTFPGSSLVVIHGTEHRRWPEDVDAGAPGSECFREVELPAPSNAAEAGALADTRVFEIVCR